MSPQEEKRMSVSLAVKVNEIEKPKEYGSIYGNNLQDIKNHPAQPVNSSSTQHERTWNHNLEWIAGKILVGMEEERVANVRIC